MLYGKCIWLHIYDLTIWDAIDDQSQNVVIHHRLENRRAKPETLFHTGMPWQVLGTQTFGFLTMIFYRLHFRCLTSQPWTWQLSMPIKWVIRHRSPRSAVMRRWSDSDSWPCLSLQFQKPRKCWGVARSRKTRWKRWQGSYVLNQFAKQSFVSQHYWLCKTSQLQFQLKLFTTASSNTPSSDRSKVSMRSKSLFLMLLCISNMHSSNSFLFPISRIILCKKSQACGIPFKMLQFCTCSMLLRCWIKDSQLLLQLGIFAEGVQVRGPTQGVARGGKDDFPGLIIWTSFDHLSFCPGDCAISFQCFSSLCLASLCWNLADPHCEYTIRLQSFQALNTDAKHIDKHLKTAKSCQVLRWHHSQKTWEIPLSKGSWGCWDIVPWPVSLRMQQEATRNLLYIPSCKIRRPSLYEADPAWTNCFWVWVMVLDMLFKMLWQRFHKSQAGKDKVLIAKIRAGQKKSFDRHSTQVDLAGKHSTKSLPGKIWWVWWCRLMQWVCGLANLMTVIVHFDQVSDMAIVWIEYSQICCAPWKTCRGRPHLSDMKKLTLWVLCLQ